MKIQNPSLSEQKRKLNSSKAFSPWPPAYQSICVKGNPSLPNCSRVWERQGYVKAVGEDTGFLSEGHKDRDFKHSKWSHWVCPCPVAVHSKGLPLYTWNGHCTWMAAWPSFPCHNFHACSVCKCADACMHSPVYIYGRERVPRDVSLGLFLRFKNSMYFISMGSVCAPALMLFWIVYTASRNGKLNLKRFLSLALPCRSLDSSWEWQMVFVGFVF